MTPRDRLTAIWQEAVRAVDAGDAVERALGDVPADGRVFVLSVGKAAYAMAARAEALLAERVSGGLVVTKDGHAGTLARLEGREAGHPLPDSRSEQAARLALQRVAALHPDDVLLVLLSGGASALTACPAPGLTIADLVASTDVLLASGADIAEMNAVRKHLSDFSGGRLARAAGCRRICVLAVSDVPGDALEVIGSGPCLPDSTGYGDALDVIACRDAQGRMPARVISHLERGASGEIAETPNAHAAGFAQVRHTIVASNADARKAAVQAIRSRGITPIDLGSTLTGEAREAARELLARARAERANAPLCLVAGGETSVTFREAGRGGRNQEFALAAALSLAQQADAGIAVLAAGTDGTDGPTDAAGAFVDSGTVERGTARGADAAAALVAHDSYTFFAAEGGALVTGPTGTNVMDLVLIEVAREAPG